MRRTLLLSLLALSLTACTAPGTTNEADSGTGASSVTQQIMPANQEFDRMGFITQIYRRSGRQVIVFDEVEWLTGEDAAEAFRDANPNCETDGGCQPPNNFFIRNDEVENETLTVHAAAPIQMISLGGSGTGEAVRSVDTSFRGLQNNLTGTGSATVGQQYAVITFWIAQDRDGNVTAIREQYVP